MDFETKKKVLQHLISYITENKKERIAEILPHRTKYITVVLEDIYQSHNASAVVRTCDCFGIQDLHIIENRNKYDINPQVLLGSSKWVNMHKYNDTENNTETCLKKLKSEGYRIVAASPHQTDGDLEDFDLSKGKTAILFGTEKMGLSPSSVVMTDEFVKIPMFGFTESLNISNCAAIILFYLTSKLKKTEIDWQLTEEEKVDLYLQWLKRILKKGQQIEDLFIENLKN
jgi:tRNA (guanosine-2'-O-)-methyltransferase